MVRVVVNLAYDPAAVRRTLGEAERTLWDEGPQGLDVAPWAWARHLRRPAVTCVVPAGKRFAQVEADVTASTP